MMGDVIKVYGWRNIHTDEWYIGKTSQTMKNRSLNGQGYRNCPKFWSAIQEWGWSSFEENILRLCTTQEESEYWEKFYIERFDSIENGYNLCIGGGGKPGFFSSTPEETRKKMSESEKGKIVSKETKRKQSDSHRGHIHSDEHKKKISDSLLGENNPFFGKHHTEESKKKMSDSHKKTPVKQFTLDGQFIAEYPSAHEASRQTGVNRGNITSCCRGTRGHSKAGNNIWRYAV